MDDFKVGDIVQLKSGGPKMTVQDADQEGTGIWCQWFAGSKLERGHFPKDSVIKIDDSEKKKASA
jgi:uncharacterized protein YodC (DUF2158 family)